MNSKALSQSSRLAKPIATSTVGRGKAVRSVSNVGSPVFKTEGIDIRLGDSLDLYEEWDSPTTIVSDGAYGVLGFEGDTSDHVALSSWYEPHIEAWSSSAVPSTTLWFWNSEIGWASVHPTLEKHGWQYVNANIWNKGKGHIAGNVNTNKIRRFPVVSEVCAQYVFESKVNGQPLKEWLLKEWKRTGLKLKQANEACEVKNVATRKYFDQGHLWYFPPPEMMMKLQSYANKHGKPEGRPYFSLDGKHELSTEQWELMRSKFTCPHGFTNIWERPALRGDERIKLNGKGKAIHLNQKPLDLMSMIIEASTDKGDVVWEPFGGLFTGCLAAQQLDRRAFGGEIDRVYFSYGIDRFKTAASRRKCLALASD